MALTFTLGKEYNYVCAYFTKGAERYLFYSWRSTVFQWKRQTKVHKIWKGLFPSVKTAGDAYAYALSVGGYVWRHREGPEETSWGLFIWVFFFYSNPINTRTSPGDALSTAPPPRANIAYIKFPPGLPSSFLMRGHTHTHITHLAVELLAEVFSRNARRPRRILMTRALYKRQLPIEMYGKKNLVSLECL